MIPDYSDSFLQMQDSCVLHTDIRKINLDILSNSKGRDVEARRRTDIFHQAFL